MKNRTGMYITSFVFALLLLFILIFAAIPERLDFSQSTYFILLIILDLAATTFLSIVLKSKAEYKGNIFKGNLSLTGPVVIFLLILYLGFKFKPEQTFAPFDLTFNLRNNKNDPVRGVLSIEINNELKTDSIKNGQVYFPNIEADYRGKQIPVSAKIEGYKISDQIDTLINIPKTNNPVIRLRLLPVIDSTLFAGYVLRLKKDSPSSIIPRALVNFSSFNKIVQTDSLGYFQIFLSGKQGQLTHIKVFYEKKLIKENEEVLSNDMHIFVSPD